MFRSAARATAGSSARRDERARREQGSCPASLEDGLSGGDLDLVGELVSPDVVTHDPLILDAPTGADSIRGGFEMLRQSFPDLDVEILDLLAEGDRVATFPRMSGTNTGAYRRGGATGRRGTIRAFFIWRISGGRIVENWGVADRFDFLQQLGLIPSGDDAERTSEGER
jgi:predicted ester cyclase